MVTSPREVGDVRGTLLIAIMVLAIIHKNTYRGVTLGLVMSYALHRFLTLQVGQFYVP